MKPLRTSPRAVTAVVALALGLLCTPAPLALAQGNEGEARAHFNAGLNLLNDPARPRYDDAYAEFKQAFALSGSAKILGNLGLCAMKLERDAEAIGAYSQYLRDVDDLSADDRAQIERDLATLKMTLATVTITTRPGGATLHDTRIAASTSVTNVYGPVTDRTELRIRRGHHIFRARLNDGREASWESDISGGETHVFDLPPIDVGKPLERQAETARLPARPLTKAVYIAGGLTLATGVGALVTGVIALDKQARFATVNNGDDPDAARDLRKSGTTLNIVSDALLATTVIGIGITAYLILTRPSVARSGDAASASGGFPLRF